MNMQAIRFTVLSMTAGLLLAGGCGRYEKQSTPPPSKPPAPEVVKTAELPPGHPPIDMSAQKLPPGAMADATDPQWSVPKDWQQGKQSPMRRGSFVAKGADGQTADIAVTVFPGDVGGMAANVNRWRSQIGLGPIHPDQVDALATKLDVNGLAATVVDFANEMAPPDKNHPQRMLVATIPYKGNSWFIKMTGDAPLVEAQKETFLQFVKSVKF